RHARKKTTKVKSRIYTKGDGRLYGDFRDVGGKREALKLPGATRATTDEAVARQLYAQRLAELTKAKTNAEHVQVGLREKEDDAPRLKEYASSHLKTKAQLRACTEQWLEASETMLRDAVTFFGADRRLTTITVDDVKRWTIALLARDNGRGRTFTPSTVRK